MLKPPVKSLSEAIYSPVSKAYKLGGLGLSFLTLGSFLMLVAFFWKNSDTITYLIAATGLTLILSTCVLFYIKDIKPLFNVRKNIQKNSELIDEVQRAAIEMTELTSNIQSLIFKHANQIIEVNQFIMPKIKSVPIIGELANSDIIVNTKNLSSSIVEGTNKAKQIINDVQKALVESDPSSLKKYLDELQEVNSKIEDMLEAG